MEAGQVDRGMIITFDPLLERRGEPHEPEAAWVKQLFSSAGVGEGPGRWPCFRG